MNKPIDDLHLCLYRSVCFLTISECKFRIIKFFISVGIHPKCFYEGESFSICVIKNLRAEDMYCLKKWVQKRWLITNPKILYKIVYIKHTKKQLILLLSLFFKLIIQNFYLTFLKIYL